ncbi:hypothetical protein [Acaryochloris marina]|uniref:Uncharacterized protein n=1 Tax=Acaryochloris marina (strain MBIC 11017) TaxID=329726 RepID=A8ZMY7_ACAM1|nr:hypothetical protein [Acaryochloris marina]ABW32186.1 hypothetical protein AM1_C0256 [Acaryochloris marina MBIC11017]
MNEKASRNSKKSQNSNQEVQQYFKDVAFNESNLGDQQLIFDPETGELVIHMTDVPINPDAVVADSIAEQGFF